MKLHFERPVLIGFAITAIVLIVLGIFSYSSTSKLINNYQLASHERSVISNADLVLKAIIDIETGQRGFVIAGKEEFLDPLYQSINPLNSYLKKLDSLTIDDPSQQTRIDTLYKLIDRQKSWHMAVIEARKRDFEEARSLVGSGTGKKMMDEVRQHIKEIQDHEEKEFGNRNTTNAQSLKQLQYSFIGLSLAITLIIFTLFYMINQTLHARNKFEDDLKRSLLEARDLYDNAPCGYLSVNSDIYLSNINQTLLNWLGYSEKEVVGKKKFEDLLSPQSKEVFLESFQEDFDRYKKEGYINDLEFDFCRKDGTTFPVIVNSVALFDHNRDFFKSRSTVFDNRERKKIENRIIEINQELEGKVRERTAKLSESEKIYKAIASHIPGSVIVMLDMEERYVLAEGDLLNHMSIKKESLIGKTLIENATSERYAFYKPLVDKAYQGITTSEEIKAITGEDTLLRITPLKNEQDEIFGVLIVLIDISEIKKAQSQLAELNQTLERRVEERTEQLSEVNKELQAITYSVSHDLRAPLRAITGYAQIIKDDYSAQLDEEGQRVTNVIIRNAARMGQLIDDLLEFSRMNRKELSTAKIDMNIVVKDIVNELTSTLPQEKYKINIHPLNSVVGDLSMMRQVWINLLSNAIKYSQKKEVAVIEIGSFTKDDQVHYYIKDNGAGFDMKYVGKLFAVFQRLHKMNEFEGTGVGLALIKTIVQRHGGQVTAEGKVNEGATFTFSLPLS